jgi:hypothetical protein
MRNRIASRTGTLPDDNWLAGSLASLDERTLKVLVETGPWIITEVAGLKSTSSAATRLPNQGHAFEPRVESSSAVQWWTQQPHNR